jgi:hypothetical protein
VGEDVDNDDVNYIGDEICAESGSDEGEKLF